MRNFCSFYASPLRHGATPWTPTHLPHLPSPPARSAMCTQRHGQTDTHDGVSPGMQIEGGTIIRYLNVNSRVLPVCHRQTRVGQGLEEEEEEEAALPHPAKPRRKVPEIVAMRASLWREAEFYSLGRPPQVVSSDCTGGLEFESQRATILWKTFPLS